MDTPVDPYCELEHALLSQRVTDIASGQSGILTAVVREAVAGRPGGQRRVVKLAWIRGDNGIEWTTSPDNIVAAA
ncbi:hypothetical protein [Streptomyces sp. NPDC002054]|uniref:hypothetical protein n=1 Tax=Streptomyces sp. NPDC002054 TaxID=3154663 RepID=UPI003333C838